MTCRRGVYENRTAVVDAGVDIHAPIDKIVNDCSLAAERHRHESSRTVGTRGLAMRLDALYDWDVRLL